MQALNDDMDELFRKAAAHYPLKTDSADWDALLVNMQTPIDPPPAAPNVKWNFFLYFIIISPLFFLAHLKISPQNFPQLLMGATIQSEKNKPKSEDNLQYTPGQSAEFKTNSLAGNKLLSFRTKSAKGNLLVNGTSSVSEQLFKSTGKQKNTNKNIPETTETLPATYLDDKSLSSQLNNKQTNSAIKVTAVQQNNNDSSSAETKKNKSIPDSIAKTAIVNKEPITKKDSSHVQKGFYAGIVAGPDFSTVKLQEIKNVGYNAGVVIGYRISKRFAVETGALWAKKQYYSDGKYFNKSKIPYTPGRKLLEVDGWCEMVEIPVTARYFFRVKGRNSWYVNAGLSSYLMSKESYSYLYEHNNYTYPVDRTYINETRDWFSVINTGIGYERRWGKKTNLRVEPYIKIPVNGIGFGSLPVSSVGLTLGLTVGSSSKN